MFSKLDKKIIGLISQDIPLVKEPFRDIADKLGIGLAALIARIKTYKKNGLMRKFSAALNHRKIGFQYNAMAVWDIPNRTVDKAGKVIASFAQVSHCYQRKKSPDWNYNLYTMIHAKTKGECLAIARDISKKIACGDYRVLFSSKEYKKTPVKY